MVFNSIVSAQAVVDFYFNDNYEDDEIEEDFVTEDIFDEEEIVEEEVIVFSKSKSTCKPKICQDLPKTNSNKFECPICMTDYSDDPTSIVSISDCSHKFCKDCLSNYITFKTGDISCIYHTVILLKQESGTTINIEILKTYGIPCPGHNCRHVMQINELTPLGTNDALQQFARFIQLHQNNLQLQKELKIQKPVFNSCPLCHSKNIKKIKMNRLHCLKCGCCFCDSCGKNHPRTVTCKEYLDYQKFKKTNLFEIPGLIRCPKCYIFTEKNGGCNFMTCKCGQFFCNICAGALTKDDHFVHFFNAPFENKCKGKIVNT